MPESGPSGWEGAAPPAPDPAVLEWELCVSFDPDAAQAYLGELLGRQGEWQSLEAEQRFFACAAEARDAWTLFQSYTHAGLLRQALNARRRSRLLSDTGALLAWADKYAKEKRALAEEALWEWPRLGPEQRTWLISRGESEESWRHLAFSRRHDLLARWAGAIFDELLQSVPGSDAQMAGMEDKVSLIWDALDGEQKHRLEEHMGKCRVLLKSLADAEKRLAGGRDHELELRLEEARNSAGVEDALAILGRVFDGMGVSNEALRMARPSLAEEGLDDDAQWALLADMLKNGLLAEIAGTTGGDLAIEFHKTVPLKVVIGSLASAALAWYDSEKREMGFNRKYVEAYLKTAGLSPRRLMADKTAFNALVAELAPTLVHEAAHQRQHAWREERGIPRQAGQEAEIEACQLEALYVLEKSARDGKYRRFLQERQDHSIFVKGDLAKANLLRRDLSEFRGRIRERYYPHLGSLEYGKFHDSSAYGEVLEDFQAELKRRPGLPASRRRMIEVLGKDGLPDARTSEEFRTAYQNLKTPALQKAIRRQKSAMSWVPEVYAEHRKRYDRANALIEQRLADLTKEEALPERGKRFFKRLFQEPPPPSGGKK